MAPLKNGIFSKVASCYRKLRENELVQKKERLICNFNELQKTTSERKNKQITITCVKTSIINLMDIALTGHQTCLLNLGPKFVPIEKKIPFMEIITATESVVLNLEYHNQELDAESIRQNVIFLTKVEI